MRLAINGQPVEVAPGATVAAALSAVGAPARRSVSGEARGPLCAMGICFECRVTIDGQPHQRSCQIPAVEGMRIDTDGPYAPAASTPWPLVPGPRATAPGPRTTLIVGAGPAGLAAAARAAEAGAAVTLVDDNPAVGGQIWRGAAADAGSEAAAWAGRARRAGVAVLASTRIVDAPAPGRLRAESPAGRLELGYQRLVLATGARECFLPFPGWTFPHVFGAGGLQAMVKGGLPIAGKRVVVAGAGPLLVAVAAYLRAHGARLAALCDQASWPALARFSWALPWNKIAQAAQLARQLRGVPVWMNTWPVATAPGCVTLQRPGRRQVLACDYLAVGFHLVPNAELALLLGCATQNGCVVVNERQETSVANVYCAGEPTGVGGVELALAEGEVAGLCTAGRVPDGALLARRARYRAFARQLAALCRLRPELRGLAQPDTLVCRCEDVSWERLRAFEAWRPAKLHTRCGMGPCQGRVCGPACEFLFGWPPDAVRPPLFPAAVASLAGEA